MTIYTNQIRNSVFASVEFTPALDGNFSFFRIRDTMGLAEAKEKLASLGQQIIAETSINGAPMLVTRGRRTDYSLLNALAETGNNLKVLEANKGFSPWKLRGWASMIGQPLQLVSAFLTKSKGIDSGVAGFATLNIIANVANITFGAEQSKDVHQLQFLKKKFNYEISKYLPDGASTGLPSSYDDRMHLRTGKEKPPSLGTRAYEFVKRNSVSFCEIGLRYVGAIMLVFPYENWRKGFSDFGGSLKDNKTYIKALSAGAKGALHADPLTAKAGIAYVAGKTLAFTSKIPDPYDPKPHTWMDTIRERVVFPLSSAIEAVAAGTISYNSLFKKKITYEKIGNKLETALGGFTEKTPKWIETLKTSKGATRDWFGGIGGALFTMGLVIRMFANYGDKKVDTKELNAHIVDGLSQVPPEKLPQLIGDFSAYLTEHFKGQVEFGAVYKELTDGLYRHHQIALPNIRVGSVKQLPEAAITNHESAQEEVKSFATQDKKAQNATSKPLQVSHQDRLASTPANEGAALGA